MNNKWNKLRNYISFLIRKSIGLETIEYPLDITFDGTRNSAKSIDTYNNMIHITIGVKDLCDIYDCCFFLCSSNEQDFSLSDNIIEVADSYQNVVRYIKIDKAEGFSPYPEKQIETCPFLSHEEFTIEDYMVIAYYFLVISHEFGHVFYDKEDTTQLDKEYKADNYAYSCINLLLTDIENTAQNTIISGVVEGMLYFLKRRTANQENSDMEHPHTIVRICRFMEAMNLPENHNLWVYTYCIIKQWIDYNQQQGLIYIVEGNDFKTTIQRIANQLCQENG